VVPPGSPDEPIPSLMWSSLERESHTSLYLYGLVLLFIPNLWNSPGFLTLAPMTLKKKKEIN